MLLLCLLCSLAAAVSAFRNPYPRDYQVDGAPDVGEKLILTPYIEKGDIKNARKLSEVPSLKGQVKSYSGYVTVDKACDSNMFFWFFPVESNNTKAPIIVWLQGGPGATSMYGLFTENGPYKLSWKNNLSIRKYSWTQVASVVFIDNPVGTGYSYAKSEDCYCKDEVQVGKNLLSAVKQIIKLFPEYNASGVFVAGESYGGKYAPALSYAIHKDTDKNQKINLQGVALGNGLVDPVNQLIYSDYLYQLGLLDDKGRDYFKNEESTCKQHIANKKWKDAFMCFDHLLNGDTIKIPTFFQNATGFDYYFNYLHAKEPPEGNITEFMTRDLIRKSIHVGNATWNNGTAVELRLMEDVMQSVRPWVQELLEHYPVLIYNGQLDIIVAYPLTVGYLQKLEWSAAPAYKTAKRRVWRVDGEVAGYSKTAGKLTEVMVRNAGHMVPQDQPKWALDMISRFIFNKPFA